MLGYSTKGAYRDLRQYFIVLNQMQFPKSMQNDCAVKSKLISAGIILSLSSG